MKSDGVLITDASGMVLVRGGRGVFVADAYSGAGQQLRPDAEYGVACSAGGILQVVAREAGSAEADVVLMVDTNKARENFIRLAGGQLQVRGPDAERIRAHLETGSSDPLTDALLVDFFGLHRRGAADPEYFQQVHDWFREIGGWRACQMSS